MNVKRSLLAGVAALMLVAALASVAGLASVAAPAPATPITPTDYSQKAHWLHVQQAARWKVDVFYVYPTASTPGPTPASPSSARPTTPA